MAKKKSILDEIESTFANILENEPGEATQSFILAVVTALDKSVNDALDADGDVNAAMKTFREDCKQASLEFGEAVASAADEPEAGEGSEEGSEEVEASEEASEEKPKKRGRPAKTDKPAKTGKASKLDTVIEKKLGEYYSALASESALRKAAKKLVTSDNSALKKAAKAAIADWDTASNFVYVLEKALTKVWNSYDTGNKAGEKKTAEALKTHKIKVKNELEQFAAIAIAEVIG